MKPFDFIFFFQMEHEIISERGYTIYPNGDLLKDDDKDFVIHGCRYMMDKWNITLTGIINAYKDGCLYYGEGGWQFKVEPQNVIGAVYWSAFSQRWIIA